MKKLGNELKNRTGMLILWLAGFCLLGGRAAYSLSLPDADLQELQIATQTIEVVLNSLRQGMGLLVLLLALSIVVNILLVMTIWKLQDQVKSAMEVLKQTDLVKESLQKLLGSKISLDKLEHKADEQKTDQPPQEIDGEYIEVLQRGK